MLLFFFFKFISNVLCLLRTLLHVEEKPYGLYIYFLYSSAKLDFEDDYRWLFLVAYILVIVTKRIKKTFLACGLPIN